MSTILSAGIVSLAASPAVATPSDPAPDAGDPRATAHPRNASDCADAGLPGEIVLGGGESSDTHLDIDPSDVPEGFELTGIVIKGGDAYNVYPPTALTELRAPYNNGGNIPGISHWFACAVPKSATTTTPTTPPPGDGDTSGGDPSPATTSATTTGPAALGSGGAVAGDELANTGFPATAPLLAGVALLALGGGLLLALRRSRRS